MSTASFIHRFVPAAGPSSITLLLLHGTGGTENDLLRLGGLVAPGAALLSPRGQVSENGMPRFFRRIAEGVFDMEDLKSRTQELAAFIAAAKRQYGISTPIVAFGYSNGANIAASLMLSNPGVLAGGVLLRAMVPFIPENTPDLTGTKILMAYGERDGIAPPEQAHQLAALFTGSGAAVEMHRHRGGHELGQDDVDAAQAWLARFSGAAAVQQAG